MASFSKVIFDQDYNILSMKKQIFNLETNPRKIKLAFSKSSNTLGISEANKYSVFK